jgi:hypothetical protein
MTRIKGALHGLMVSIFILAAQLPFDVDIIHQGTDPMLVEIMTQIECLRQKMIQIAGPEKIAEFDLAMASEMRKAARSVPRPCSPARSAARRPDAWRGLAARLVARSVVQLVARPMYHRRSLAAPAP